MDNKEDKVVITPSLPLNKKVLIINNKHASEGHSFVTVLRGCKQFVKVKGK